MHSDIYLFIVKVIMVLTELSNSKCCIEKQLEGFLHIVSYTNDV